MGKRRFEWRVVLEAVGVAGLIASLIVVASEIQQNTAAARSAVVQSIADQSIGLTMALTENAELRLALVAAVAGEPLSADQETLVEIYYAAIMRLQHDRFIQSKLGVIDLELLLEIGGRGANYRSPVFLKYWEVNSYLYPDDFRAFVDSHLLPLAR